MNQYEVTFIVDPVLSGDEIKATAQVYVDMLQKEGAKIVHVDELGLRQLAYPIKRRSSGIYYVIEFQIETGEFISKLELALRRDERVIRFLTVRLDKFGVKYNEDKRAGKIGKVKTKKEKEAAREKHANDLAKAKAEKEKAAKIAKAKAAEAEAAKVATAEEE